MLMNDLEQIAYKQMRHLLTLRDAANVQLKNIEVLCGDARLVRCFLAELQSQYNAGCLPVFLAL